MISIRKLRSCLPLGTGHKLEGGGGGGGGGGGAGANMGRATDFHASSKGRAKQFGACHLGGGHYFLCKVAGVKESI